MAIDIGTNSTLHLVADVSEIGILVVDRGIVGNSLGADIGADGVLSPQLLKKNLLILQELVTKSRRLNCENIGAVGTYALRRAANPQEFVVVAQTIGVPVEIISENDEARLAWRGVFGKTGPDEFTGLLDIGGGSCELLLGKGSDLECSDSIPTGAVTLALQFFVHDPPEPDETKKAEEALANYFTGWAEHKSRDFTLFGIAGTITALTAIKYGLTEYVPGCLDELKLTSNDVKRAKSRMLTLSLKQREAIPGMPPARAESIHAGVMILDSILTVINKDEIIVSERGVLFGLAQKLAEDSDL